MCALRDNPNQYVQVGVTSWGIGCGSEIPAVYASLEANLDWLLDTFNRHSIPLADIQLPVEYDSDYWVSKFSSDYLRIFFSFGFLIPIYIQSSLSDEKKYELIWPTETGASVSSQSSTCNCRPINECHVPRKPPNTLGVGLIDPK